MIKVYLVFGAKGWHATKDLLSVFSTSEKAQSYISKTRSNDSSYSNFIISESELDAEPQPTVA